MNYITGFVLAFVVGMLLALAISTLPEPNYRSNPFNLGKEKQHATTDRRAPLDQHRDR